VVSDSRFGDWKSVWGDPELGDWDLDDMQALIDPEDWSPFARNMDDAYTEYLLEGGQPGSIPGSLLDEINEFLDTHGLRPQVWWAELYGQ
jgi:hypothetical protein